MDITTSENTQESAQEANKQNYSGKIHGVESYGEVLQLVSIEEGYFMAFDSKRITGVYDNPEDAKDEVEDESWAKIVLIAGIIAEKVAKLEIKKREQEKRG